MSPLERWQPGCGVWEAGYVGLKDKDAECRERKVPEIVDGGPSLMMHLVFSSLSSEGFPVKSIYASIET